jgi:hypothetical protein
LQSSPHAPHEAGQTAPIVHCDSPHSHEPSSQQRAPLKHIGIASQSQQASAGHSSPWPSHVPAQPHCPFAQHSTAFVHSGFGAADEQHGEPPVLVPSSVGRPVEVVSELPTPELSVVWSG